MRNFTEEQNMFRESYRRFLEKEVVPHMERFREQGIVDREIFQKAGEQGMLSGRMRNMAEWEITTFAIHR